MGNLNNNNFDGQLEDFESQQNGERQVVKPSFGSAQKKKKLIEVSDEQMIMDDINSTIVNDSQAKKVKQQLLAQEVRQEREKARSKKTKKKMSTKAKVLASSFGVVVVALVVVAGVLKQMNKGSDINIIAVNVNDYIAVDTGVSNADTDIDEYDIPVLEVGESVLGYPLNIGTYHTDNVVVNAQLVAGDGYKDYTAPRYWGLTGVGSGYHEVATELEKINNQQGTKYSIGRESDFKDGDKPVIFTVDLQYPSNFPSSLGDQKVTDIPDVSIRIIGNPYIYEMDSDDSNSGNTHEVEGNGSDGDDTSLGDEQESQTESGEQSSSEEVSSDSKVDKPNEYYTDYIEIDGKRYTCEIKSVTNKPTVINIETGFQFKFVTTMKQGVKDTDYIVEVKIGDNVGYYKGVTIE